MIFTDSQGWQSRACTSGGMVTIKIRETGGSPSGDIPGDSDVVIRVSDSYSASNIKHEDIALKGTKCNICKKVLTW